MTIQKTFDQVNNSLKKPGILLLIFTVCFVFWFDDFLKFYNKDKKQTSFTGQVLDRYSYLPAVFFFGNSFDFEGQAEDLPVGTEGKHYPRHTYGMALLYLPFFAVAAIISSFDTGSINPFSMLFADCIRWGMVFYLVIGLIFLRKFLLFWFSESIVALTLLAVLYGSMLYFYAFTIPEFDHAVLFALFCIFLYYVHAWHLRQRPQYAVVLACIFGLVSLIRLTEIYIILFFILWNVKTLQSIKEKWKLLKKEYKHLLLFPLCVLIFWLPQVVFRKIQQDSFFFDANGNEGFFWSDPQFINILFSYRKGWLLYTPLAVLAFFGFFFIKKDFPLHTGVFVFVTVLLVYIYSCWWDWTYALGFGNRAFCQFIAFLSIPLAFLFDFVLNASYKFRFKGEAGLALIVIIFSCVSLNTGQAYQFLEQQKLHPNAMTRTVYWEVFRHYHYRTGYEQVFPTQLSFPDYENWMKGIGRDDKGKNTENE